jgi:putative transposase
LQDRYRISERRSCAVLRFCRRSHRYQSTRDDQAALRQRIRDIAATRVRYGFRRIHVLLRREGWMINHKRVRRLYREEGLNLRLKRPAITGLTSMAWSSGFLQTRQANRQRLCGIV